MGAVAEGVIAGDIQVGAREHRGDGQDAAAEPFAENQMACCRRIVA